MEKYYVMNNVKIAVIWAFVETIVVFPHRGVLIHISSIAHVTHMTCKLD